MIFTKDQKKILNVIESGQNVFITGPGGTGKSTILQILKSNLEKTEKVFGITATTGSAAVLIGGCTLHSYLGIGLGKESYRDLVVKIKQNSKKLEIWKKIQVLVVDEISMCPADLFNKLFLIARAIRNNSNPFGGIQLIFSGDFLQLPCISGNFIFLSEFWEKCNFETFYLQEIIRQSDKTFQKCLNKARIGQITYEDIKIFVEKEKNSNNTEISKCIKPTKILCHNIDVDLVNERNLKKLPSKEIFSYKLEIVNSSNFLGKIDPNKYCNAKERVDLAIGAQVMLLVNLDVVSGFVNGSRGVVTEINSEGLPIVLFKNGCTRVIGFHAWEVKDNKVLLATIFQIPLKLAWAVTVHKSQGVTLDYALIDLYGVFEYGQAYVALSRVKNLEGLEVLNVSPSSFKAHPEALEFYKNLASNKKDEFEEKN